MQTKLLKIKLFCYQFFFLVIAAVCLPFPQEASAYPAYTANSDLVISGPYDTVYSGSDSPWGLSSSGFRELVTLGQKYRIRQNGTINQIKIYTVNKTNLTGFYLKIWRKNGSTYDLIGSSENLVNNLVAGGSAIITLSSPIAGVLEGDYYGYRVEKSGGTFNFTAKKTTGNKTYLVTDIEPTATNYDWESKTNYEYTLPIELYMQAPQVVFIGDSIIAGHPAHYSFLETTATTNINSTIEKQFGNLTGYTYQNMGIGSQTTSNISARFTADVLNLKPKIVVIEGGVNDIAGAVAKSTFIANWTSMLDAAQADSSITTIIVLKILPWTNGSTANMQTRDDWNASLATLVASYSKAIVVDASSYVGQFRAGGDEGNLWNIQAAYNADGVHFNQAGHTQIAQAIADSLPKPSATFDNDFSTWNSGDITVNYNLIQTGGNTNTNISQTGSSGIEYSTDGSIWSDATDAGGASEGLTGLTSSALPGDNHVFVWDSSTDLPTTEDSTVYLRIRPNDGTADADDWITSDAFAIDNVAPSAVGVPTFGTITASSIEIIKPTTATENGSGFYQWQARRNSATELGYNATSTASVTNSSLSENTQYTFDVKFKDNANNVSSYGTTASKYTLAATPTNLDNSATRDAISLTVDSFPNSSSGSSGYYFYRTDNTSRNSGWINTNTWTDTGLTCGSKYNYSVKYRNGDGVETSAATLSQNTEPCVSEWGSSVDAPRPPDLPQEAEFALTDPDQQPTPPAPSLYNPSGGFNLLLNGGAKSTSNPEVALFLFGGPNTKYTQISEDPAFGGAKQEKYTPHIHYNLKDNKLGKHTIYIRYFTLYDVPSETVSQSIILTNKSAKTAPPCKTTIVKTGDTLWALSRRYLFRGSLYPVLVSLNKNIYSSLSANPGYLMPGWELKVECR